MKKKTKIIEKQQPIKMESSFGLDDRIRFAELNRGIIRIDSIIDPFTTTSILQQIEYVKTLNLREMSFMITSLGGNVDHALAIYDRIMYLPKQGIKTVGIVEGLAASSGAMIVLQSMQKRYATPSSRFLLHEIKRSPDGFISPSMIKDETGYLISLENTIHTILAKRCKRSKKEISELIGRRDVWLSAKEAKKLGLIDAII